jgi:hypothetical protein
MPEIKDPNQILAKEIIAALIAKDLILESNSEGIKNFLNEGKMKDTTWITVFERKITDQNKANES